MHAFHINVLGAVVGAGSLLAATLGQGHAEAQVPASRLGTLETRQAVDVVDFAPGMTLRTFEGKPDRTVVAFPDGRRQTLGELRRSVQRAEQEAAAMRASSAANVRGQRTRLDVPAARRTPVAVGSAARISDQPSQQATPWGRAAALPGSVEARRMTALDEGVHGIVTPRGGRVVSPGDMLTIWGFGFGDTLGEAQLVGQFPGGQVPLRVVHWRNNEIKAQLQADIRGVLDHEVALQVVTAQRRTMPSSKGGHFVAAREDITLDRGIGRVLRLDRAGEPEAGLGDDGVANRWQVGGSSLRCWKPGADKYTVLDPGKGFVVSGFWYWTGRQDEGPNDAIGRPGYRSFTGRYTAQYEPADGNQPGQLWMGYGVWESTTASDPSALDALVMRDTTSRGCGSWYRVQPILTGPAGVNPF